MSSDPQIKNFQVSLVGEGLPLQLIAQVEGHKKLETLVNEEGQIEYILRQWLKLLDSPPGFQKFIFYNGFSDEPRSLIEACSFRFLIVELVLELRRKRLRRLQN